MKNVVIWESVNCSQQMLQSKANFLVFIKKCLIRLRRAVDEQNLSHFIDRDRNLFEAKIMDEKTKRKLITYLDGELIGSQKLVPVVFECIGRNNLKELWNWCRSDPAEFLSNFEDIRFGNNQELKRLIFVYTYGKAVWEIKGEVLLNTSDFRLGKFLQHFEDLKNTDVEKQYVDITETIIRFYYKLKFSESRLCTDKDVSDYISRRKTRYTDALSDRLYLSTCLIRFGRFREAEVIINEFLNIDPKIYIYCGTF